MTYVTKKMLNAYFADICKEPDNGFVDPSDLHDMFWHYYEATPHDINHWYEEDRDDWPCLVTATNGYSVILSYAPKNFDDLEHLVIYILENQEHARLIEKELSGCRNGEKLSKRAIKKYKK